MTENDKPSAEELERATRAAERLDTLIKSSIEDGVDANKMGAILAETVGAFFYLVYGASAGAYLTMHHAQSADQYFQLQERLKAAKSKAVAPSGFTTVE